jgi:hypothetical protein
MSTMPITFKDTEGPTSLWALHIPSQQPEGISARVRLYHRTSIVHVFLRDSLGDWSRAFWSIEEYTGWLDYIARGPVILLDPNKPNPIRLNQRNA